MVSSYTGAAGRRVVRGRRVVASVRRRSARRRSARRTRASSVGVAGGRVVGRRRGGGEVLERGDGLDRGRGRGGGTVGHALPAPLLHRRLVGRTRHQPAGAERLGLPALVDVRRVHRVRRRRRDRRCGRRDGPGLEHRGRQRDERDQAGRCAGTQLDADAVTGGERADDVQAERPREREPDHRRLGEQRVRLGDAVGRHADALVGHREHASGRRRRHPTRRRRCRAARTTSRSRAARRGGGRRRTPHDPTPRGRRRCRRARPGGSRRSRRRRRARRRSARSAAATDGAARHPRARAGSPRCAACAWPCGRA